MAAVLSGLTSRLTSVQGSLREAFGWLHADASRWWWGRQRAASELLATRTLIGPVLGRSLPRAAALGARHAGGALPAGHDPLAGPRARMVLDRVDGDVHARLSRAAHDVVTARIETPAQLTVVLDRVAVVGRVAALQVGDAVAATVADGVKAVADERVLPRVWVAERDACGSCLSMSGSVALPGGLFAPVTAYGRIIPWFHDGLEGPPGHGSCRCHVAIATPGLADGLAREAARSAARGLSAYDSLPARLAAAAVAARSTRLPASVTARAAHDHARGAFSSGHPSRTA